MMIIFENCTYEFGVRSLIIGIFALFVGSLGFLMSIIAVGVVWIIPSMRTQLPPHDSTKQHMPHRRHPTRHTTPQVPNRIAESPPPRRLTLRRSSSLPGLHQSPSSDQRPETARHVSFDVGVETPDVGSTTFSPLSCVQRRWSTSVTPFAKRMIGQQIHSPTRTPRSSVSSEGSGILVPPIPFCNTSSAEPAGEKVSPVIHDLPLRCFDVHCECHSRAKLPANDMGVLIEQQSLTGITPTKTSRSMSLSMRLPKIALVSKRRDSAGPSTPMRAEDYFSPGSPSKQFATASGTDPTTPSAVRGPLVSRETYRAGFVSPLKLKKAEVKKLVSPVRNSRPSSIGFTNPWNPSYSTPLPTPEVELKQPPSASLIFDVAKEKTPKSRKTLAIRFAALRRGGKEGKESASCSSSSPTSIMSSFSPSSPKLTSITLPRKRKQAARTQPYGPPYNLPMPGQITASDPEVYVRNAAMMERRRREKEAVQSFNEPQARAIELPKVGPNGQYPPENMIEWLSAVQSARGKEVDYTQPQKSARNGSKS